MDLSGVPLGFGIEVPDGYAGYVFPRTSMAVKGLVCELPPVDSGYRGEFVTELGGQCGTGGFGSTGK